MQYFTNISKWNSLINLWRKYSKVSMFLLYFSATFTNAKHAHILVRFSLSFLHFLNFIFILLTSGLCSVRALIKYNPFYSVLFCPFRAFTLSITFETLMRLWYRLCYGHGLFYCYSNSLSVVLFPLPVLN